MSSASRILLLLLTALVCAGHLHQVLGQYDLHDHEVHEQAEGNLGGDHDGTSEHDRGMAHLLGEHQAVAECAAEYIFVPLSQPSVPAADEKAEQLPDAVPQAIAQPPRRS